MQVEVNEPMLTLAATLRARKHELVSEWMRRVRRDPEVPIAAQLPDEELSDHSPMLLDEAADALEGRDHPRDRAAAASEHGAQRTAHGYDIRAVTREIAILRQVLIDMLEPALSSGDREAQRALHAVLDDSIAASVGRMEQLELELLASERDDATRARRVAERLNHDKDLFVAVVAHEIRNPLQAMLGWVTVARERVQNDELLARAVEAIARSVALQQRLVDDLLDLERVRSGKLSLERRLVDVARVVDAAVETAQPRAVTAGIELRVVGRRSMAVQGDAARLTQVLANLLTNALKFTPRDGTIEVRMAVAADIGRVEVADSGAGIAREIAESLFEPYHQADPRAGSRESGIGLGLALVRELVGAHGGRVGAESGDGGTGATFWIELPLATPRPAR